MVGETLAQYGRVHIISGLPLHQYTINPRRFSPDEQDCVDKLVKILGKNASLSILQSNPLITNKDFFTELQDSVVQEINLAQMNEHLPTQPDFDRILSALENALKKGGLQKAKEIALESLQKSVGYSFLAPLLEDDGLEEVMVNGFERNVFVFHREHGQCTTNVSFHPQQLADFIQRIARTDGKDFGQEHSLLDAHLPDGNRVNATFDYVTPHGHTLTIRKFYRNPISIIDLIESNTITIDVAAFLWAMVEGMNTEPKNVIITGGTGSGKTTLMNVLGAFIPGNRRIISIEDTLEVDLGKRDAWIQMESKKGIKNMPEVSMDDLLKNALRMRPDRIIVGEVRGPETQTLFVAMDTGHAGILGTLHANSARESLVRMKTPPMNVPESMLPLLDLIVVMQRVHKKGAGAIRTIKHIAEVTRLDEKTLLSNIFEYDLKAKEVQRTDVPSAVIEDFAHKTGLTKKELKRELLVREKILEWMIGQEIKETKAVEEIIQEYYFDQQGLLERISKDLYPKK
jgi:archaeal flagellar protein FlaI